MENNCKIDLWSKFSLMTQYNIQIIQYDEKKFIFFQMIPLELFVDMVRMHD